VIRSGGRLTFVERRIALATAVLAVVAVLPATEVGWGLPQWWALPVLILAIAAAEATSVRMVFGRQGWSFSLTDALLAVGFVLAPGAWIPVGMVFGFVLAHSRRLSPLKLAFNLSQYGLSVAAGVAVTLAVGGGVAAAGLGLVAYAVLNHLLVGIPVSLATGEPYTKVLSATCSLGVIHQAGNISVGLLAGWLALNAPTGLLGLVVPLGLLWWSYQQQARRASEARLYAELARGQERLGGTVDASAQVVVTAAARLFGAAQVEVLLRHPDGLLRYVGDERGVSARLRVDNDAFDAPWVLRALAARGVLVGYDGEQPYCSAVLGDPERPLAVLVAHRPQRTAPFTRGDAQLAELLVGQAESWLSVAELTARHDVAVGRAEAYGAASRVLGDLGSETVPALALLRESADRLSRLAAAFDGPDPVSEIVAELHAVERAVASLLGAIALASDPRPAVGHVAHLDGSSPAAAGDMEWTTTGRLEDAVGR
jgi:hypothetical protein